jgi:hypothetical protein
MKRPLVLFAVLVVPLAGCSHGPGGSGAATASPSPSPTPAPPQGIDASFKGQLEEGTITGDLTLLVEPEMPVISIELTAGTPSGQWSWRWKGGPPQPTMSSAEKVPLAIPRRDVWERQLQLFDKALQAMDHACPEDAMLTVELRGAGGAALMSASESCVFGIDATGTVVRKVKTEDHHTSFGGFLRAPDGVAPLVRATHPGVRTPYATLYWPDGAGFRAALKLDPADAAVSAASSASRTCSHEEIWLDGTSLVDRHCAGKKTKDVTWRFDGQQFKR